jgi:hypothetical protein
MKRFFTVTFVLLALGTTFALGQNEQKLPDLTFEVLVQVVGTSAGDRREVPANLTGSLKSLKSAYGFSDYGLVATFIQRTSSAIEYKGPQNAMQPTSFPNISEWGLRGIRRSGDSPNSIIVDGFRFGMRVPIGMIPDKSERQAPAANYEWFGFSNTRFKLTDGETTLIGSLESGNSNATLFVFLTVHPI